MLFGQWQPRRDLAAELKIAYPPVNQEAIGLTTFALHKLLNNTHGDQAKQPPCKDVELLKDTLSELESRPHRFEAWRKRGLKEYRFHFAEKRRKVEGSETNYTFTQTAAKPDKAWRSRDCLLTLRAHVLAHWPA